MNKAFLSTLLTSLALIVSVSTASASGNTIYGQPSGPCIPTYGGGTTCPESNLTVNKLVAHPKTGSFVENLGSNDPKYSSDQTVNFQIVITNSGNTVLNQVTVRDIFPTQVTYVSGAGNYDANAKILTFEVANMQPGESRIFVVTAKVTGPVNPGVSCVVNQAIASNMGKTAQDNASFCIESTVTTKGGQKVFEQPKVTTTPPTGPEALALVGLIPTGALGYFLRKKSLIS